MNSFFFENTNKTGCFSCSNSKEEKIGCTKEQFELGTLPPQDGKKSLFASCERGSSYKARFIKDVWQMQ